MVEPEKPVISDMLLVMSAAMPVMSTTADVDTSRMTVTSVPAVAA